MRSEGTRRHTGRTRANGRSRLPVDALDVTGSEGGHRGLRAAFVNAGRAEAGGELADDGGGGGGRGGRSSGRGLGLRGALLKDGWGYCATVYTRAAEGSAALGGAGGECGGESGGEDGGEVGGDAEDEAEGGCLPGVGLQDEDEAEGDCLPGVGLQDEDEAEGDCLPGVGLQDEDEAEGDCLPGAGLQNEDEDEGGCLPGVGLLPASSSFQAGLGPGMKVRRHILNRQLCCKTLAALSISALRACSINKARDFFPR